MKVARNEKRKKLLGFSFYINIGNFEAFLRNLNLSAKHLFWTCVLYSGNMAENSKSSRILKAFCMETTLHGWAYLTYDEKVSPKCAKYETNYLPKCFFEIQLCSFIFATGSSDLCGLL